MPPAQRLSLSQLNKAALVNLARHLALQTGGTKFDLRSRISDCLYQNPRLLDEAQLNRLFPTRQRAKANQQPPPSPRPRSRAHAEKPALLPLIHPGTASQGSVRTQPTTSDSEHDDLRHPSWESISQNHSQANSYSVLSQTLEPYLQRDLHSDNPFLKSSTASSSNSTSSTSKYRLQIDDSRAAVGGTLNDSVSQLAHIPPAVTSQVIRNYSANTKTPKSWGSVARPSMNHPQITNINPLVVPQRSQAPVGTSQQVQGLMPPPQSAMLHSQDQGKGMFDQAKNFVVSGTPTFINNNASNANIHINSSDNFMVGLLQETIIGAASDSSARDPPPRCHPGTRLTVLEQCVAFIVGCTGKRKIRWVFGAAGVGKTAIMQSVAERNLSSVSLRASIFFFANGRSDGSKAIVTLAYQLAVKCEPYCQFIKQEIVHDPSILHKSMSVQFDKFIVEPFIHHPQLNSVSRILIIIDGLDECDKSHIQRELLRLISDLCLIHPSSPIVWMIASRPEYHITSFFAQSRVEAAYEKEEIVVDSDEAREDVERLLRTELKAIQDEFDLHPHAQWPSEEDFWKLADASGGLFVYAQTVLKYIGNRDIGDPTGQLKDVLDLIHSHSPADVPREKHPMAHLDALYARILSKVPARVEQTLRRLLLTLFSTFEWLSGGKNFVFVCNWLGITRDEAYAALRPLSSVLYFPSYDKAHVENFRCFHKSFLDYIFDFSRSGYFLPGKANIAYYTHRLHYQYALRVLGQAPDGIDVGDLDCVMNFTYVTGTLARGPGTGDNILLTWPVDEQSGWDENKTKLDLYRQAVVCLMDDFHYEKQPFDHSTVLSIRLFATRFESLTEFTAQEWFSPALSQFRDELMEQGLLQEIPIKVLSTRSVVSGFDLQFRRPATPNASLFDPWNPCEHWREGEWGEGKYQDWHTWCSYDPCYAPCDFCRQRFENKLESWKTRLPDYQATVLFTSAGIGVVEFQFVDPEDGISEWTYVFAHKFDKEERMKLGSLV